MPNAPQPGRIAPKPPAGKSVSGATSSASKSAPGKKSSVSSAASGMMQNIALGGVPLTQLDKVTGAADARIERKNRKSMENFRRDIESGGKGHVPKTKKGITGLGQGIFIAFGAIVDIAEIILDCFVVGVAVNRIIDIVVGIIFLLYAVVKGLSFTKDFKIYGSIIGTFIGEMVPVLDVAPFFALDAWYITSTIKAKDKARQKALNNEAVSIVQKKEQQNWIEDYQEQMVEQEEQEEEEEERAENEQEILNQRTTDQNETEEGRIGRTNTIKPERSSMSSNQNPHQEGRVTPPETQKSVTPFEQDSGTVGRIAPLETRAAEAVEDTASVGVETAGAIGNTASAGAEAAGTIGSTVSAGAEAAGTVGKVASTAATAAKVAETALVV
jgi:hypothetical protein